VLEEMNMRLLPLLAWPLAAAVMTGCLPQPELQPESRPDSALTPVSSTEGVALVRGGIVTDVRDVTLRGGQNSAAGSLVGSMLGGFAGSAIGSGHGRTLATIAGAAAGSMAGQYAGKPGETSVTKLTVCHENGDVNIYDVESGATFRVGDAVKIVTQRGNVKVTH
jgi:outer membrane lipoprotein SlyB